MQKAYPYPFLLLHYVVINIRVLYIQIYPLLYYGLLYNQTNHIPKDEIVCSKILLTCKYTKKKEDEENIKENLILCV